MTNFLALELCPKPEHPDQRVIASGFHLSRFVRDWGPTLVTIALAVFTLFLWLATKAMAEATQKSTEEASRSSAAAQTSADAAKVSADATAELLTLEKDRWQAERIHQRSVDRWHARLFESAGTAAHIVRVYNGGPGDAHVQAVRFELENGGDPGLEEVVMSNGAPFEVRSGEYFRVDFRGPNRSMRLVIIWIDGRGVDFPQQMAVRVLPQRETDQP